MKSISKIVVCVFFFVFLSAGLLWAQDPGEKVKVSVTRIENLSDDSAYDAICDTMTDTIEFTLRLMGSYRIERTDYIDPYEDLSKAKEFYQNYNFDNAIFGTLRPGGSGTITVQVNVYDRKKDRVTIEETKKVDSYLEIFDASDELAAAVVESFTGVHIGFGTIRFTAVGEAGDTVVYIDGEKAGMNPQAITVLQGERMVEIRHMTEEGERVIERVSIEVKENEETEIAFTLTADAEKKSEESTAEEKPAAEEPLAEEVLPVITPMIFDDDDNIQFSGQLFFPNFLNDYKELFEYMEETPEIPARAIDIFSDYRDRVRRGKIALIAGVGAVGAFFWPFYIGTYAAIMTTALDMNSGVALGFAVGGAAGMIGGLISAGIGAAVVFTASPGDEVDVFNYEMGF